MRDSVITVGLLIVYFVVILFAAFGTKAGKLKEKSIEEFAVGNRGLGWVIVLFIMMGILITASTFASWFSWTTFEGVIVQYLVVYSTLGFLFSYVFAKKIWIWGRKFNLLTQPDYVQLRYRSRPLTLIFAASAILIEAPWVVIEFAAMGILMNALTFGAISVKIGTIIVGVIVVSYILYSGMKAIAITELIQGIVSSVVIAFGLFFVVYKLWGGFGPLFRQVMEIAPENLLISRAGAADGITYSHAHWSSIIITGSLGIMGWASFFSRIYTSKSIIDVKRVSYWSALLGFIFSAVLMIVGLGGVVFPDIVEAAVREEAFFQTMYNAFGPWFLGFAGIVVVAAGMSMVSVIMNSHGVIIAENFIKPLSKVEPTSESRMKVARWSLLIYSVVAIGIALLDLPNLYSIALIAYEGIAQIVPMLVFSLYWKRSNKYGALFGFVAGLVVAIIYAALGSGANWTGGVIGLLVNVIIHVACGFIFPKDSHVDELFEVIDEFQQGGKMAAELKTVKG
jgi:SSS family solute:Na+ symporter